jgi:hypothetical protein
MLPRDPKNTWWDEKEFEPASSSAGEEESVAGKNKALRLLWVINGDIVGFEERVKASSISVLDRSMGEFS